MMPYPAFVLRQEAAAVRQLLLVGAVQLGQGGEDTAIALAQLRSAARV